MTDRDLELLAFVAAHRFVLASHVQTWLAADRAVAYRRLSGLVDVGLLSYRRIFHAQPGCYQVTNGGLAVIDSELPRPTIDLRTYRHDTDVVWLWLVAADRPAAAEGRVLAEREMRSHDQRRASDDRDGSFGIPVGGYNRAGRPRVHFPDVLLVGADGSRVAFELELSVKGRRRLEDILLGYAGEPRLERVMYVTDSRQVAAVLNDLVERMLLAERVEVRYFQGSAAGPRPIWWRSLTDREVEG